MIATIVPNSAAPTDQRFARNTPKGKAKAGFVEVPHRYINRNLARDLPTKLGGPYSALSPVISIAWP